MLGLGRGAVAVGGRSSSSGGSHCDESIDDRDTRGTGRECRVAKAIVRLLEVKF